LPSSAIRSLMVSAYIDSQFGITFKIVTQDNARSLRSIRSQFALCFAPRSIVTNALGFTVSIRERQWPRADADAHARPARSSPLPGTGQPSSVYHDPSRLAFRCQRAR
jgi:hypothetical protein